MSKGYIIMTEAIKDPAGMKAYGRAAKPAYAAAMAQGGLAVLAADRGPQVLEGEWHGDWTVILEFQSVEAARAWYESPAYQEAVVARQAAADINVVLVSGFELPKR